MTIKASTHFEPVTQEVLDRAIERGQRGLRLTDPQVSAVLIGVVNGDLAAYDVMTRPVGEAQIIASAELNSRFERKCEGWSGRGGVDDDFELILDAVCDDLAGEYEDLL